MLISSWFLEVDGYFRSVEGHSLETPGFRICHDLIQQEFSFGWLSCFCVCVISVNFFKRIKLGWNGWSIFNNPFNRIKQNSSQRNTKKLNQANQLNTVDPYRAQPRHFQPKTVGKCSIGTGQPNQPKLFAVELETVGSNKTWPYSGKLLVRQCVYFIIFFVLPFFNLQTSYVLGTFNSIGIVFLLCRCKNKV